MSKSDPNPLPKCRSKNNMRILGHFWRPRTIRGREWCFRLHNMTSIEFSCNLTSSYRYNKLPTQQASPYTANLNVRSLVWVERQRVQRHLGGKWKITCDGGPSLSLRAADNDANEGGSVAVSCSDRRSSGHLQTNNRFSQSKIWTLRPRRPLQLYHL